MLYKYEGYSQPSSMGPRYGHRITFEDGYSIQKFGIEYRFADRCVEIARMAFNERHYWVFLPGQEEGVQIVHKELEEKYPLLHQLLERKKLVPSGPSLGISKGAI